MTALKSTVDTTSVEHKENREALLGKLAELDAEHAKALAGGGPKYVERHRKRGKLMARERIELVVDQDARTDDGRRIAVHYYLSLYNPSPDFRPFEMKNLSH